MEGGEDIRIYLEEGRVGSLQSDAPICVEGGKMVTSEYTWRKAELAVSRVMLPSVLRVGGWQHLNIPGGRQSWQSPE